jgi:ketosteroid isomerase-like protein
VYKAIVRRQVRGLFEGLGSDYDSLLARTAPDVHHVFPGDSALGGERHSRDGLRRWFQRLDVVFKDHELRVKDVVVSGLPWRTVVAVEWTIRARTRDGAPYENEGVHVIRMRWGRATAIHAYLDSERLAAACERSARAGVAEASAPPIVD